MRHFATQLFAATVFFAEAAAATVPASMATVPAEPLQKTPLPNPAAVRPSIHPPQRALPRYAPGQGQATLVFTATGLGRDYRGRPMGASSLRFYAPGGRCAVPPQTVADTQNVTADQPYASVTLPADQPLVLASFWSAGDAYCLVGDYDFTPVSGGVYKLTNVQNVRGGVCHLRLQRLSPNGNRYQADHSLRPANRSCPRDLGG